MFDSRWQNPGKNRAARKRCRFFTGNSRGWRFKRGNRTGRKRCRFFPRGHQPEKEAKAHGVSARGRQINKEAGAHDVPKTRALSSGWSRPTKRPCGPWPTTGPSERDVGVQDGSGHEGRRGRSRVDRRGRRLCGLATGPSGKPHDSGLSHHRQNAGTGVPGGHEWWRPFFGHPPPLPVEGTGGGTQSPQRMLGSV